MQKDILSLPTTARNDNWAKLGDRSDGGDLSTPNDFDQGLNLLDVALEHQDNSLIESLKVSGARIEDSGRISSIDLTIIEDSGKRTLDSDLLQSTSFTDVRKSHKRKSSKKSTSIEIPVLLTVDEEDKTSSSPKSISVEESQTKHRHKKESSPISRK